MLLATGMIVVILRQSQHVISQLLVRQKGTNNWFVGGKTGLAPHLSVLKLDFLDKGRKYEATIYADAKDADYEKNPKAYTITKHTVKKGDVLKLQQVRGGGFAISLKAL